MKYDKIISQMTLEEKASMMSGKDFWQTMNIDRLQIPSMFLADGPHGIRKQAAAADHLGYNESIKATCFPTAATSANSWNVELGEEMAALLGEEAKVQRVNVLLGPGTNIKRNPLCGRNFEYFSEDPHLAGSMSTAYIKGIQKAGISSCIKHYAANNQELRRMVVDTIVDERALREIYLPAFEMAMIDGKSKTIMSAYNKINGEFANENPHLMVEILRNEWKHEGMVVTDWGGCNNRVDGIKCGNELEMPTTAGATNILIVEAVKNGTLKEVDLDICVDRLLDMIFSTKIPDDAPKSFDVEKHHNMAQKMSEESIVLLKNKNGILPLAKNTKVAVIGDFAKKPRYQGAGSSNVNCTKLDSTLDVIGQFELQNAGFESGFERHGKKSPSLAEKAANLAANADVIMLYIGLDEFSEVEGIDRKSIKLPQNQLDLIDVLSKTGKKIVAVLLAGSCVETGWIEKVDAVVYASLAGQAGAKAILNVVTGAVNPSGKLSETYPVKYEDCSSASNFPGKQANVQYRESIFVGYRYYDTANVPVSFPFGFGLSYTNFEYSNLSVNDEGAKFTIKNTGKVDGKEVCQLYVGANNSNIFRPKKELKGFKKVFVKAGESAEVFIPFDFRTFRFFDVISNSWQIEKGEYSIMIGASVSDIKLKANLEVDGISVENKKNILPSYYSGKVANVSEEEFAALYGKPIPDSSLTFYKKNRIIVGYNTTVAELRYAKGWFGRLFAGAIRFAKWFMLLIGNRGMAELVLEGMLMNLPLRNLSRMGGVLSWKSLNGIVMMCNGKFFKGFAMFIGGLFGGKKDKKAIEGEK